jgi:tryptophan-rich sensory protein
VSAHQYNMLRPVLFGGVTIAAAVAVALIFTFEAGAPRSMVWNSPTGMIAIIEMLVFALFVTAGIRTWRTTRDLVRMRLMSLFTLNAALSIACCVVFFLGSGQLEWARGAIVCLWGSVLWLVFALVKRSGAAAVLVVPYFVCVSIVGLVNEITRMNVPFGQ